MSHQLAQRTFLWRDAENRSHMVETAIRGLLAVSLYVVFPPFSDVHRLWERAAGLNDSWPVGSFEYPPISALYFEPLAASPSSRWAVAVNGLIMVLAALAVTWTLLRVSRWADGDRADVRLWVASPAVLLFLPINWDVLVTMIALAGIVALYQSREALSGSLQGLGTAFKIFPGALVVPLLPLIEGWRRRCAFLIWGFVVLVGSYLAYAAIDPDGWRFHLDFASSRADIESTIWGVFPALGLGTSLNGINVASTVSIALALLLLTVWVARARPGFADVAVLALTVMLLWILPFYAWIRASHLRVRLVEAAAIVAFVVVYFDVPKWINTVETVFRSAILVWLAWDVMRRNPVAASPSV
jgi:hypothetical protein